MQVGRWVLGALFVGAGITHWTMTPAFSGIVPDYLPAHREIVLLSGVAEVAGGLGLLWSSTRRPAAWGLFVLLIVVFPANLWMAQHPERYLPVPGWALWARLPLQLPLLWWTFLYTRRSAS